MLGIVYSVASYLGFLMVYTYFAWFSDGIGVPKSVDSGSADHLGTALLVDLGAMLIFGLQHSIMARAGFKRALTRIVPAHLERATYVLASSAALAAMMWLWRPLPEMIFQVENPTAAATLWAINALGWLGVPICSLMIDHFDLFGIKRAFEGFRRKTFGRKGFVTPFLYQYVRHPMMTSLLVAFWVTPRMSIGHSLLSLGMTVYIVIGVHFEEKSLCEELGVAYARYRETTPKFLPFGSPERKSEMSPSSEPASREAL